MMRHAIRWLILPVLFTSPTLRAANPSWKPEAAAKYLDARGQEWFDFAGAHRGEGATRTTCLSCHTSLPYALARPTLRKITGTDAPTEPERRLLAGVTRRVDAWAKLDTPAFVVANQSPFQVRIIQLPENLVRRLAHLPLHRDELLFLWAERVRPEPQNLFKCDAPFDQLF